MGVVSAGLLLSSFLLSSCTGTSDSPSRSTPSTTSGVTSGVEAPPLSASAASQLSAQLSTGTEAGLRAAVAIPTGQTLDPGAAKALAALGPVTFDLSTLARVDPRTATVTGAVAHPPPGEPSVWTFTLVYVNQAWLISDTEPKS